MQEHVLETTKQHAEQTSSVTSSPAIVWPGFGLASSSWFCGGVEAAWVARRRLLEQLKFSPAGSRGTCSPWSAISNLQLFAWSTDWHHSLYHISFYTCKVRPLRILIIFLISSLRRCFTKWRNKQAYHTALAGKIVVFVRFNNILNSNGYSNWDILTA